MAALAGDCVVFCSADDHVGVSVSSEPVADIEQSFERPIKATARGVLGDQASQVDVIDESASVVVAIAIRHLGED
jgi:hypothetical protein